MATGLTDLSTLDAAIRRNQAPSGGPFQIELKDLYRCLAERKRMLGLATLAGLALSVAAAFLLPDTYEAQAIILPPQQQQSTLSMLSGQLGSLAGLGGKDLGFKNPADVYVGILGSQSIADSLIAEFDLRRHYATKTAVDTRKRLARRTNVDAGKDTLIKIAVEDEDAARAAALANAYVSALHKLNTSLALGEAAQRRLFFEQQIDAAKKALVAAETALTQTQKRTGVLHISGQVEASIRSIAQVRAEIASREIMLERLRAGATESNPEVVRHQLELKALRSQLAQLQASTEQKSGDPVIGSARIPDASLDYIRALREVKYQESLFEYLARQFEAAKLDEIKQAPVIQVVDPATTPDKRSGPPRLLIGFFGTFFSFAAAAVFAVAQQGFRNP
jgi:uncharacterized protein involved in exopolysaccharide biosynthesis